MPPTHPADPADPADNGDHAGVDVDNGDDDEAGVDVDDPALIPILQPKQAAQTIAWLQHGSIPTVPDDHHIYTKYVNV